MVTTDESSPRGGTGAGLPTDGGPAVDTDRDRISVAPQWKLMWWRFRKHKVAVSAGLVILAFYLVALLANFFAYSDPDDSRPALSFIPPQPIQWFADDGSFSPHVYPLVGERDMETFKKVWVPEETVSVPIRLFAHGYEYRLLGLFETDIHLIGVPEEYEAEATIFLLGSDNFGRDIFSRLVLATRTSLTIGLVGVFLSLVLGVTLGGISGYYGGATDSIIQRLIEILRSVPVIPLWLGIAAALPLTWSPTRIYFSITLIISLIGWTTLGREVRGRFLQLRHEDFIMAARLCGASDGRIIRVHMVPLMTSHIIAATTLAVPLMIIAETSLSFLGLGLRPPAISWGVMLQDAQNVQTVAQAIWMLIPVIPVIVAVLAFNFLGDGVRDAADPYGA